MLKKLTLLFLCIGLFITCEEDENLVNPYDLKISSFQIITNNENSIYTKTYITPENLDNYNITDHGIVILKNGTLIDRLNFGQLQQSYFDSNIRSGIVKGERYEIFPFIFSEKGFAYGDTLSFESNVEVNVTITDLYPRSGFIRDTLVIKGENFCSSSLNNTNILYLGESRHVVSFESDSIINAVIMPYLDASELLPAVKTCGITTDIDGLFSVNPPILDSISSENLYVGDELLIYGKNIHRNISKVWLGEVETELAVNDSISLIKAIIPENLPSGKLDFKLQVLDKIIEKSDFYQSTTPIIEEITPRSTGFLDTITIRGNFFNQRNSNLEILIGGRSQKIISNSDQEIRVVIDKLFRVDNPELVLNTGTFNLTEPIIMLPPQILGFDKEKYYLDDEILIKTKYYLGDRNTAKIGGVYTDSESAFSEINNNGTIKVDLEKWLNPYGLYPSFNIKNGGLMEMFLETHYGISTLDFSLFAPHINEINDSSFFHESSVEVMGTNFGYNRGYIRVADIYIDDVLIEYPGTSIYELYNGRAKIKIPSNLYPGVHSIKIITGGQQSNEMSFSVKELTVSGITPNSGTRKEVYMLNGNNLEDRYAYKVKANGYYCDLISTSRSQAEFKLPQSVELNPSATITVNYGSEVINAGTINVIEPYERIPSYEFSLSDYHLGSFGFTYNNSFHFINRNGIFKLDNTSYTWNRIEEFVPTDLVFSNGKINPPIINNKLYIKADNNLFKIYDFISQTWETRLFNIEDGFYINRCIAINENSLLLTITGENYSSTSFYIYNTETDQKEEISLPSNFTIHAGNTYFYILYSRGTRVYLSTPNMNVFVYDTTLNTWRDIGHPKSSNFLYDMNLFEYNNILYFSGGQANEGVERGLFTYDFSTNEWKEKTPMLNVLKNHFVFENNNNLYFLLGNGLYGYENNELLRYNIEVDPN